MGAITRSEADKLENEYPERGRKLHVQDCFLDMHLIRKRIPREGTKTSKKDTKQTSSNRLENEYPERGRKLMFQTNIELLCHH